MKKIKKILVANRGEIAIRVMRAAKELNIGTVAIYSKADQAGLHIRFADECFLIESDQKEPYLDIRQIIGIAQRCNADAIHPGYGFLSENPEFSKKVSEAGLLFIGPSHHAISMMGDKLTAKSIAKKAGVPVIPGIEVDDDIDWSEIEPALNDIGFPVLIKARAGGGGKGMRLIRNLPQMKEELGMAVNEARDAFGDGRVFVEKYIENPRHIEIQILADHFGNTLHLFERECSIQRRHQKVIEESPSAVLDKVLRKKMGDCAVTLAKACNYENAGTIEFILDKNKQFYFLEMNTRLQVEHPVTEFVTGLDMVKLQIRITEGERLGFAQEDLQLLGHAIELRVYAEDPENNFMPDIGKLVTYRTPNGIGVRVDDGYEEGMEIPLDYDPLLAKLIVFAETRDEAIIRMIKAIDEYQIQGVKNTLKFGRSVMSDPDFCAGEYDTNFVEKKSKQLNKKHLNEHELEIAALLSYELFSEDTSIKFKKLTNCQSKWRERLK